VITLCAARHQVFMGMDVKKVRAFQRELLNYFDGSFPKIGEEIEKTGELSDEMEKQISETANQYRADQTV